MSNTDKQDRYLNFDTLRCFAIFMVIMVHALGYIEKYAINYNKTWLFVQAMYSIVFACNGIFFMLSGYFTLDKFDKIKDEKIFEFYKKKIINIIIPFFLISIVYYVADIKSVECTNVFFYIIDFLMKFITGNISPHFWFLYYMIGAYIISPFVGKMLITLSDKELKIYTTVSFVLQVFITLIYFTNYSFNFQAFLAIGLVNWLFYYQLGYTIKRLKSDKIKLFYLIGIFIISIIVALLQKRFFKVSNPYIDNQGLTMVLTTISFFFLTRDYIKIPFKKLIYLLAKHSYTMYLIHILVLNAVFSFTYNKELNNTFQIYGYWFGSYIITCIITIVFSIIINKLIFNPLLNILRKHFLKAD